MMAFDVHGVVDFSQLLGEVATQDSPSFFFLHIF
jgi:hypothetical protein